MTNTATLYAYLGYRDAVGAQGYEWTFGTHRPGQPAAW